MRKPVKEFQKACMILCVMTACAQGQSNDIVAEGEKPVRVADSYSFSEGPAADAKGDMFFRMYFDAQGNLIACADMDNQLWSFDTERHPTILLSNNY